MIFCDIFANFFKNLGLPESIKIRQDVSRATKKCQEVVQEVTKKYSDFKLGTLLVQIRTVGQGPSWRTRIINKNYKNQENSDKENFK